MTNILLYLCTMITVLISPILDWFAANHSWLQVLPMVFGITYMTLQIFQHKWMWYLSILTSTAALSIAMTNMKDGAWAPLWAQVVLNVYLICVAIAGIINWKKLEGESSGKIHVVPFKKRSLIIALIVFAIQTPLLAWILSLTSDPAPVLDAASLILSFIAAWMLARSHKEQYLFWIVANVLIIAVYAGQSQWFMVGMYSFYIVTCVTGYINWSKNGVIVE